MPSEAESRSTPVDAVTRGIMGFLRREFLIEFNGTTVGPQTDLFTHGYIDSFGFVELVTFLEETFDIKFETEELLSVPLTSVEAMAATVRRKQHGP